MGKGAALVLHGPRAGAGAKEVVGAAQEAAAMARGEGGEWDSRNGWALVNGALPLWMIRLAVNGPSLGEPGV